MTRSGKQRNTGGDVSTMNIFVSGGAGQWRQGVRASSVLHSKLCFC
jgi:hypothetical protein